MCWDREPASQDELETKLGERGDFVAVKTAELGRKLDNGQNVTSDDVTEVLSTLCEVADLVLEAEEQSVVEIEIDDQVAGAD